MNKLKKIDKNLLNFHNKFFIKKSKIRDSITKNWSTSEKKIIPYILKKSILSNDINKKIYKFSKKISKRLRNTKIKNRNSKMLQDLLQKFSLSSEEGISLMCLSEALLRIPDQYTRDELIRDKISNINWYKHLSKNNSLFINITSWSLLITGKFFSKKKNNLLNILYNTIGKIGKVLIRKVLNKFMKLIGDQFITGENIKDALKNSKFIKSNPFNYSYDMLGEAALTKEDSIKYIKSYKKAIKLIGKDSLSKNIYKNSGISIKLSALHPKYNRLKYDRVINELYPTLKSLVFLAYKYNIGINIDAEESDRLELSLDLLEKLCFENKINKWNGIGFVVQAYQKRSYNVIKYLIDLAKRSNHRLMIRLVKGAYWDSEIKRAQLDGLNGYPVYTRKPYTDISYIACARKLLSFPDLIYPQFATHNANTLASIYYIAGKDFYLGQYEFQCLHGMGNILYEKIVRDLKRPCRIYAPVGTHKTLLAYLIRRLLENGANTSFVNKISDKSISINNLIKNPIDIIKKYKNIEGKFGYPNPKIPLPINIYKNRINSLGINLFNEISLKSIYNYFCNFSNKRWNFHSNYNKKNKYNYILNPNNHSDIVGKIFRIDYNYINLIVDNSLKSYYIWKEYSPLKRAEILEKTALMVKKKMYSLISLLIRESGKTFNNAISEIREVIDFLNYYSYQVKNFFNNRTHKPIGIILCISPWNFPLAIFTGQISASIVVGNTVLAKPSEQTPLIAAQIIKFFIKSGLPENVIQLIPIKSNIIGNELIYDNRIKGIVFTGSYEIAKKIEIGLANRLKNKDKPITLIAETGGLNTMIVDSSALTEQVVIDVINSAFDSAGQRCSALRLLCLQEEIYDFTINMIKGSMKELKVGNSSKLDTDIGPIINYNSKLIMKSYILNMKKKGFKIYQINKNLKNNLFSPTMIELNKVEDLKTEIFGPVLHVIKFKAKNLNKLINSINKSGYGLTLGIQSRIDNFINKIVNNIKVGNFYINRNMIGAVVGVQPFGGEGLSGTGPKAGGPLYLHRLLSSYPKNSINNILKEIKKKKNSCYIDNHISNKLYYELLNWAKIKKEFNFIKSCKEIKKNSLSGLIYSLEGPTGEENLLILLPKKNILCISDDRFIALLQLASVIIIGGKIIWIENKMNKKLYYDLPKTIRCLISFITINKFYSFNINNKINAILYNGDYKKMHKLCKNISINGPIIIIKKFNKKYNFLDNLLIEKSLSINVSAIGGNPELLNIT